MTTAGCLVTRKNGRKTPGTVGYKGRYYQIHRIIWEMFNGTIPEKMVIDHLDRNPHNNNIDNLACKTNQHNLQNKNKYSTNKSGFTGIYKLVNKSNNCYYVAYWVTLEGKRRQKLFSVDKLGDAQALELAILYRKNVMEGLNQIGACYTEHHGN